jgi:RNA polymerase sigma-70 factor (ECF subfamily)
MCGDRDAFAALAELHVARVYAFLAGRSQDRDIVDEAFQETWLRVVKGLPRLREPEAFRPWLYAVAHNALRDVWRQRRSAERRDVHDEEAEPQPAIAEATPADVDAADIALVVHVALARLPDRWRVAVAMRYMDDAPYAEIGAALGTTADNARKLAQRGHARLREHFARLGGRGDAAALLGSLAPVAASLLGCAIAALDAEATETPPRYAPATPALGWAAYASVATTAMLLLSGVLAGHGFGQPGRHVDAADDAVAVYLIEEKSMTERVERLDVSPAAGWEWQFGPHRQGSLGSHGTAGGVVVFSDVVYGRSRDDGQPGPLVLMCNVAQSVRARTPELPTIRPVQYDDAGRRHDFTGQSSGAAGGDSYGQIGWQCFQMPYADLVDAEYVYLGVERELGTRESDGGRQPAPAVRRRASRIQAGAARSGAWTRRDANRARANSALRAAASRYPGLTTWAAWYACCAVRT